MKWFFFKNKKRETGPVVERILKHIADENAFDIEDDADCAEMLLNSVERACAYAKNLVEELGEPFILDRKAPSGKAIGPVLFDTTKDAVETLRHSAKIKEVFTSTQSRECFFLLTMHRREYMILGNEIEGEMIKRGVLQNAVEFLDHEFSSAAPTLLELREKLTENVMRYLIGLAPARMREDKIIRADMQRSEAMLKAQMKTLDSALKENKIASAPASLQGKLSQVKREMTGLKEKLDSLSATSEPAPCLQKIREILDSPHKHFRLERVEMRVGDFGVKSDTGKLVRFHECHFGEDERLAVFLASINRDNAQYLWPELAEDPQG
jgi:hypothetical protein